MAAHEPPHLTPALQMPGGREALESKTPIGRVARPEEMPAAILLLAAEKASYRVGALMIVDGGMVLP